MASILPFLKKFFISSSSDEDVSKYTKLLNDSHVNQLSFPSSDKKYQFNLRDLQRETVICWNNNAMVVHYIFCPLKFSLVVKTLIIPIESNQVNEERFKKLIEEVKILRKISHGPNVIDFYGYAIDEEKIWIFMEHMEASLEDLYRYFHEKLYPKLRFSKEIVIPETVVSVIAVRILDALEFCKEQSVMHRDVKPSHVLVNKKGEIKLCSFGHAKILESGTLPYLPPERLEDDQPYDDRTDVWSLGITLVEIVYGDIPNNVEELRLNGDYIKIRNIIKNANGDEIMSRCFGEDYSDDLRNFVKSCLKELSSRPRYPQLMETNLYKLFADKDSKNTMKLFIKIFSESLNIEKYPLDANAYFIRGNAQKNLGKYNEAIADFTKAIELNPTHVAYHRRGDLQSVLGKYNEAIADYTKGIELYLPYADAYYNRAIAHTNLGKYNEAIADYTKAIELKPTYANAYYNRGIAQRNLNKYNEAIADYTKAIELDPTHEHAYNSRKNAQDELEEYNKAIADYTKAVELNPLDVDAYKNRGFIQNKFGKYNEAIADYTKAIELNPLGVDAYKNRGSILNKLGNYNEAIADYTKAIDLVPTQESTSERANSKTSLLLLQKEQETNPSKLKEFNHDSVTSNRYIYEVFDKVHLIKFAIPTQHYLLSDHFTYEEILFSGNHVVKKFVHKQTKTQVAIKFINIPKDGTAIGEIKKKLQKLKGEIDILQALSPSKLVTELYGYSIHNEQLLIYMEFMDMSLHDLYDLAHQKLSSFPEVLLDLVAINGLDALIYLKFKKIMHRDVKPKNILVNKSGQIKLCDFGTSKLLNNSFATTWTGTVAYLPPEAFTYDNEKFDARREVWALGLTIAEVAFGKYPIGEELTEQHYISEYIKKATSKEIIQKSMQNFDDDIKEFAGLCLRELKNRPQYESLKETQLYKKYLEHDRIQLFKETLENFNLF